MQKKWNEIDIDKILNFNEAHTGKMAQYQRIMQHNLIESVSFLSEKIQGVMETIFRAHQGLKDKADEVEKTYEEISKEQMDSYSKISDSQGRLQKWIVVLTFIIAISTVAYVYITWKSVSTMQESNIMQHTTVEAMQEANRIQQATVEAMQEANRIQNESLKVNRDLLQLEQSTRWKGYTIEGQKR